MTRLLYATGLGLIGAAIVHMAIVFLLPRLSDNAPAPIVSTAADVNQPIGVNAQSSTGPAAALARTVDPFFETIICRYSLTDGGLRIHAPGRVPLWTASIRDAVGASYFSLNDRISAGRRLDIVLLEQDAFERVRDDTPVELSDSIIVPAAASQGFAVIRVFVPDASWSDVTHEFVDAIECSPIQT